MNIARLTPRLAASVGFLFASSLAGCSGTPDPDLPGSGGLPGVGGQATGGATLAQGGSTGKGGTTNSQLGGNGNGGAQTGGATTGGATNSGGNTSSGGATTGGTKATGGTSTGGNKASGGTGGTATGGKSSTGGAATGGTSTGGKSSTGGAATGGKSSTGGASTGGAATGGASTGGASTGGAATGGTSSGKAFSQCRFHFGTIDSVAKNNGASMINQLDFFTPGWMLGASFDQQYVCDEGKAGAVLGNQVPVVVAYVAAGIVKRDHKLCDCNVVNPTECPGGDLCRYGAQYIVQDWTKIINAYKSYSAGYAACYGTTRPIIFEMEPDWYQYTGGSQTAPWTAAQAGSRMSELVAALKTNLPNARFSVDASPWVGNNGTDNGAQWYSNFNMSLFTFVNTSGGGTNAATQQCSSGVPAGRIRCGNAMTWAGLSSVTGKPILADTGYGANGASAGHDANWDSATNINARIADGVISIAQYNPNSSWGNTISGIRSQLSAPKYCP